MKISVITVTRGDGVLLRRAVDSVYAQRLPAGVELEHIVVDGNDGPTPEADYARQRGSMVVVREPHGVYNAMNHGLDLAGGDVIALLNGTDAYAGADILQSVCEAIAHADFIYGDIRYVSNGRPGRIYSAASFEPAQIKAGFAPPHPSLFVRRHVAQAMGHYREDFANAADFEYFVRLFFGPYRFRAAYIPRVMVNMEDGGASATLYSRVITNSSEKRRALKINGFNIGIIRLMTRYLYHLKK